MKRHTIPFLLLALLLAAGCGPKRRPVITDPSQRSGTGAYPAATATPEPEQPIPEGPDIAAVAPGNPSGEDFSVNDASGENGPLEDIRFDYDKAELSDEARATLEKHGLWLQNHRQAKVTVEGHCDERGTVDYNLALGDKRARGVRDYLASLGVAAERMHTVSLGKERPLAPGNNDQAFAKNRRAHFVVTR